MRGGGSERVISIILNHINREGFDITLALLKKEGRYLDDLADDINIIDLDVKQARYSIFKIIKLIKEKKPDIVFSTLGYLNILISIIRPFFSKNIKFIARESSIVSVQNKQEKYPKLFDFLYKYFYSNFNLIISQSNYMKNDLISNYSIEKSKIVVINNPVDFDKINVASQTEEELFDKTKTNILAVGRLNPVKDFISLIKMVSKLDEKYHLTIVGEGDEKDNLLNLIDSLKLNKRVSLIGFQTNPYKYMKQADMLVLTSKYEGFPNVLLEANACGTPVVAFECPGGIGEIVDDGVNGFLVECGNINELANVIEKTTDYNWNDNTIIKNTKERYKIENIIDKYQNIL